MEQVLTNVNAGTGSLFSVSAIRTALLLSLGYFFLSLMIVGYHSDQVVLVVIFNTLYFSSHVTRKFILSFSIFIIYWIIFDYMKALPNYEVNPVHIGSLYNLEKSWFGIQTAGGVLTPNELFAQHPQHFLDILSGIFYLCWVPVPLLFASYLYFRKKALFFRFALSFLWVNIIGFVGYYLFPAAPPWYVSQQGFDFISTTPGNTAGLARFDAITGWNVFHSIYSKSSNVFAAMPSLHASYMLIVVIYAFKKQMKYWKYLFVILMLGIWFSAVYTSHHYVLDVLAGIGVGLLGVATLEAFARSSFGKPFLSSLNYHIHK
ncbi:MAG: phosphatase PAP2 family protein [Flavisolibacter sp.]